MFDKIMTSLRYTIYVGLGLVAIIMGVMMVLSIIDGDYKYAVGCWFEGTVCSLIMVTVENDDFLKDEEEDE